VNPWPFVISAYAVALLGTAAVTLWSLADMRRSEREADKLGRGREG
jgi:heme export protein D (CcmD)